MKNEQMGMEIQNDEMVLLESKTMRDQHVYNDSVLDKVKAVPQMPNTLEVTIQMSAAYYDVPVKTIESIIKRNRDEFNEYGEIRVLKGKSLSDFKTLLQDAGASTEDEFSLKGINSLSLISRRGLLRIGMLLTESEVAKSIRHYLLNVEEVSDKEQRQWAVEREIARRERRYLTDAIKDFYNGTIKKGMEYPIFTDLVYKVLFDTNARGLREMYGLEKSDPLRDALTTEDLRRVVEVEQTIKNFLRVGKTYSEIRDMLLATKERF